MKQINLLEKWRKEALHPEKYETLIKNGFKVCKEPTFNSYLIFKEKKQLKLGHLNRKECRIAINTIYSLEI